VQERGDPDCSGDVNGGTSVSITAPTKPGTYAYRCNIHQYMHGVLTVGR